MADRKRLHEWCGGKKIASLSTKAKKKRTLNSNFGVQMIHKGKLVYYYTKQEYNELITDERIVDNKSSGNAKRHTIQRNKEACYRRECNAKTLKEYCSEDSKLLNNLAIKASTIRKKGGTVGIKINGKYLLTQDEFNTLSTQ